MSEYRPDRWMLVKIEREEKEPIYKVLGTWFGGYLNGDSWKMNSGVTKVRDLEEVLVFVGYTGSEYVCRKDAYGLSAYTASVVNTYEKTYPQFTALSETQALEWASEQAR